MASSKVCTLARSRRPVYACERQQGAGLQVGGLVVVDEHAGELVEVEQGDGHAGAFRLVERLLGEAAGAYVQTLVGVMQAADERVNRRRAHGIAAMLDFDDDAWGGQSQSVGGGDDVAPLVAAFGRQGGAVAHGAQEAGDEGFHVFPGERDDAVLDLLDALVRGDATGLIVIRGLVVRGLSGRRG